MDSDERDEILRALLRIAASQDTINQDLRTCIQELRDAHAVQVRHNERLDVFVERQDRINAGIQATLDEIKHIFVEMQRQRPNGRNA